MSVSDLKENIKNLTPKERDEITNYISGLRISDDPNYWERVSKAMDDKNPDHWIPLEDILSKKD